MVAAGYVTSHRRLTAAELDELIAATNDPQVDRLPGVYLALTS